MWTPKISTEIKAICLTKLCSKFEVDITTIVVLWDFVWALYQKYPLGYTQTLLIFFMQFSVTNQSFSVTISLLLQNSYQIWNLDCQIFPMICILSRLQKIWFLKHKPQNPQESMYMFYILIHTPKRATYPLR